MVKRPKKRPGKRTWSGTAANSIVVRANGPAAQKATRLGIEDEAHTEDMAGVFSSSTLPRQSGARSCENLRAAAFSQFEPARW